MKHLFFLLTVLVLGPQAFSQDWHALGNGAGTSNTIMETVEFQGDLVVAGNFSLAGGQPVYNIARWDGSAWHAMGTGFDGEVRALAVYNGELWAAGIFSNDGTMTVAFAGMAKWNGTAWVQVPVPDPLSYDYRDLYVFNGNLYTTKHYQNTGFTVKVSKFDGSAWSDLPGEFTGPENYKYLYALGEYDGKLLAGGIFDAAGGTAAQRVAIFNGTSWESLGFPVPGETGGILSGRALAFRVFEDKLYVGGIFTDFNGNVPGTAVVSYDGSAWTAYPFDGNIGHVVHDFEVLEDRLLAAGEIGYWEGTTIVGTCVMFDEASPNSWKNLYFFNPATAEMNGQDMAVVNGTLYLGGKFSHAGSSPSPVHNVVMFDGNLPTATGEAIANPRDFSVYPNPAGETLTLQLPGGFKSEGAVVTIIGAAGNEVLKAGYGSGVIDLGRIVPGIYTIRVTANDRTYQAGFIRR
jgi:hypothetical protein